MIDKDKAKELGIEIIDSQKEKNPLYENLKANFPQTINADGVVSLKAIATLLGLSQRADMQGYELTFSGKGLANALYSTPCAKELKLECIYPSATLAQESLKNLSYQDSYAEVVEMRNCGFQGGSEGSLLDINDRADNAESASTHTRNTIIRGDNLDVLKLLKSAYSEKIKMIYIDPPYNTKNDNFIYPDDFREDYKVILREVGLLLEDEKGEWVESEELRFFRNITGSKSHSGWLAFMLPRLKLARDLLKEDGVIFISIDDNEQANLKILCDEIFGEENFVANVIWLKGNAQNDADTLQGNHEYILCYAKNIESKPIFKIKQEVQVRAFKDKKTGKFYYEGSGLTTGGAGGTLNARPNLGFSIYYNPKTEDFFAKNDYDKELAKISNDENRVYINDNSFLESGYEIIRPPKRGVGLGCWTWALEKFNNNKNSILIRKNANGYSVFKKEWLDSKQIKQDERGEFYAMIEKVNPPKSFIDFAGSGRGTKELKDILNNKVFNNPKNTLLLKHLLQISTTPNPQNSANSATSVAGGGQNAS